MTRIDTVFNRVAEELQRAKISSDDAQAITTAVDRLAADPAVGLDRVTLQTLNRIEFKAPELRSAFLFALFARQHGSEVQGELAAAKNVASALRSILEVPKSPDRAEQVQAALEGFVKNLDAREPPPATGSLGIRRTIPPLAMSFGAAGAAAAAMTSAVGVRYEGKGAFQVTAPDNPRLELGRLVEDGGGWAYEPGKDSMARLPGRERIPLIDLEDQTLSHLQGALNALMPQSTNDPLLAEARKGSTELNRDADRAFHAVKGAIDAHKEAVRERDQRVRELDGRVREALGDLAVGYTDPATQDALSRMAKAAAQATMAGSVLYPRGLGASQVW